MHAVVGGRLYSVCGGAVLCPRRSAGGAVDLE